jgi:D-tyrosyl-tRNA(Tyr) deacylase
MRALIQRVSGASVSIDENLHAKIGAGLLVFIGIETADTDEDIEWICNKIVQLRILDDEQGVMNLSVKETGKEILVVSQFTLHAAVNKGNRPSYIRAARPEVAKPLFEKVVQQLEVSLEKKVASGVFGAMMQVALVNDGPVTIWMDSKEKL